MTSDQNSHIPSKCYKLKKKSHHSRLENKLKRLENRFDILDNDLIKLKWKMDNIKKSLLKSKKKPKIEVILDSNSSDNKS